MKDILAAAILTAAGSFVVYCIVFVARHHPDFFLWVGGIAAASAAVSWAIWWVFYQPEDKF